MQTPSKEYRRSKLIKLGEENLSSNFESLADWVETSFKVTVLNIIKSNIDKSRCILIQIILEFEVDLEKFYTSQFVYNKNYQKRIAKKYQQLFSTKRLENIIVVFSAFENGAKSEANENIPKEKITALKQELSPFHIWEISRFGQYTTFFFYTKSQLNSATDALKNDLRRHYYELLKPYDQFNYFTFENLKLVFDNKEVFDNIFQSNWYYYYK